MSLDYSARDRLAYIKEHIEKYLEGSRRPHDVNIMKDIITWLNHKIFDAGYEMGQKNYVVGGCEHPPQYTEEIATQDLTEYTQLKIMSCNKCGKGFEVTSEMSEMSEKEDN